MITKLGRVVTYIEGLLPIDDWTLCKFPLPYLQGLGFSKNHRRGNQDFHVKMAGVVHIGGFSVEGVTTAFHK